MHMVSVKVSDLTDSALDWAVAKCVIPNNAIDQRARFWIHPNNPRIICRQTYNHESNPKGYECFSPSNSSEDALPLIKRENIYAREEFPGCYFGFVWNGVVYMQMAEGPTEFIAAMRALVANKLGDTIEVPAQLLQITEDLSPSSKHRYSQRNC